LTSDALITGGTRPAVRLVRTLPDPPDVVWRSITDRDELRAWFPCDVVVAGGKWTVGAAITFEFAEHGFTLTGEVLEVDEPRLLVYQWGEETLRFELTPRNGGTELVLVDELPAAHAARNAAGWEVCLDRLERKNPADDAWRGYFASYESEFTPVLGAQEGPPVDLTT
jgi:uncharacterized protein YndB with AHSA1/START domain